MIARFEDILRRSMRAHLPGLLEVPQSLNDGQGHENPNSTFSVNRLKVKNVSNQSSERGMHPTSPSQSLLDDSRPRQPTAASRIADLHAQEPSTTATCQRRHQPSHRNESKPRISVSPRNHSTPRGRRPKANNSSKRQKFGRRNSNTRPVSSEQPSSIPQTPSPSSSTGPRSMALNSARRPGSAASSILHGRLLNPPGDNDSCEIHTKEHSVSASKRQRNDQTTTCQNASNPDVRETVVGHAVGRGPFLQGRAEEGRNEENRPTAKRSSNPANDNGKKRALDADHHHAAQHTEYQTHQVSATGPANTRGLEPREETGEFPSLQTAIKQVTLSRNQAHQPDQDLQAQKQQPHQQASNTTQTNDASAGVKISQTYDILATAHQDPHLPASATSNSSQTPGDGTNPVAKRLCHGTSRHQEHRTTLPHATKIQLSSQPPAKGKNGNKHEAKYSLSSANQGQRTSLNNATDFASRDAQEPNIIQPCVKKALHGHGPQLKANSLHQRLPLSKTGPMREVSLPLSTIRRWDPEQCVCLHLPDCFRHRLKPSFQSWTGIKDQFLHHCEQVMNCPAHPEITRRTCRELLLIEAPKYQVRHVLQWHFKDE